MKPYVVPQIKVIPLEEEVDTIFESGCTGQPTDGPSFGFDPNWVPCGFADWGGD